MNLNSPKRNSLAAHLLLGAVTLVWGASFPLVKAALAEVSPLLFNLIRMVLASVLLLAVNGRSLRGLSRAQVRLCALAGVLLAIGYEFQTVGLVYTTPSKSAFLTGLVVVMVPLLSLVPGVTDSGARRPHPAAYAGALVAFAGIVLLTSQPGAGAALLAGMHTGEWLTLVCAVAYALHLLTLARGAQAIPARALGTLQIVFAAGTMLVLLPLERHLRFHLSWQVGVALAVTSVLATAVAFTVQSWAQQHLPASHTALVLTLEPVFAALVSFVFFGERMGSRALIGAGCILGGILLAEIGPTVLSDAGILAVEP